MTDNPVREYDEEPDDPQPSYKVGYGQPPLHTRWQKGVSGNPKGSRKRKPTLSDKIERVLARTLKVGAGGRKRRVSVEDVILERLAHDAASGDFKAIRLLLEIRDRYRDRDTQHLELDEIEPDDRQIIEDYIARIVEAEDVRTDVGGCADEREGSQAAEGGCGT